MLDPSHFKASGVDAPERFAADDPRLALTYNWLRGLAVVSPLDDTVRGMVRGWPTEKGSSLSDLGLDIGQVNIDQRSVGDTDRIAVAWVYAEPERFGDRVEPCPEPVASMNLYDVLLGSPR